MHKSTRRYGTNPAPRGPLNWQWVEAILRAIDRYGPGTGADDA